MPMRFDQCRRYFQYISAYTHLSERYFSDISVIQIISATQQFYQRHLKYIGAISILSALADILRRATLYQLYRRPTPISATRATTAPYVTNSYNKLSGWPSL